MSLFVEFLAEKPPPTEPIVTARRGVGAGAARSPIPPKELKVIFPVPTLMVPLAPFTIRPLEVDASMIKLPAPPAASF